jgi:DNA polymerase-3 subunit beta
MKVQIAKNLLNVATNRVQGAIVERSLAQIGLCAKGGRLHVAATDRILAVYSTLACETMQEGCVFVPARLFSEVVKELPDGPVKLVQELAYLVITAGETDQFSMKLPIIEDLGWRDPPTISTDNTAEIAVNDLSYMIEQVQFCVVHDSPRNYGSVAYLHKPNKETLRLVGTDGFRLSYCEAPVAMPDSFLSNGICLSKRALSELFRMCGEGFEKIHIAIAADETTLVAQVSDYQIFIRLSAVKYPNYIGVLPKNKLSGVLVSRPLLQNVTKRVMLAADKSRALQLCFSDSSLTLNSKTTGSSEGRETVPLQDYYGPKYDIVVNGKFLGDVFSTTGSDSLTLQFNQENNEDPIVIVPRTEPSDCRSRHVLVPIKQND